MLERSETLLRFVVQTGRQSNSQGVARLTVEGRLVAGASDVRDACTNPSTAVYRAAAMQALRHQLAEHTDVQVTLQEDFDHPVDLSRPKFEEAGRLAAALLRAWVETPTLPDEALIAHATISPR